MSSVGESSEIYIWLPKLTVFGSMKNKDPKRDIQNQIILSMPKEKWTLVFYYKYLGTVNFNNL
jgi:hypothetical protein